MSAHRDHVMMLLFYWIILCMEALRGSRDRKEVIRFLMFVAARLLRLQHRLCPTLWNLGDSFLLVLVRVLASLSLLVDSSRR